MTTGSGSGGRRKGPGSRPPAAGRRNNRSAGARPEASQDAAQEAAQDAVQDAIEETTQSAMEGAVEATDAAAEAVAADADSGDAPSVADEQPTIEDAVIVEDATAPTDAAPEAHSADQPSVADGSTTATNLEAAESAAQAAEAPSAPADPEPQHAPAPAAPASFGGGGSAVWGLVGAGVGAAAMLFVAPMLDGGADPAVTALQGRLASLETEVAATPVVDLSPVEASVAAVQTELAEAIAAQDAAQTAVFETQGAETAALSDALAAANAQIAELTAALEAASADRASFEDAVEARLAAIDSLPTEFAAADGEIDGAAILAAARAALTAQDVLATELRAEIAAAQEADDAARSALRDELQLVVSSAETTAVELGSDFEAVAGDVASLGARLGEIAAESASGDEASAARVDALATDLAALTESTVTPDDLMAIEERVVRAERAATSALGRGSSVGVALAALAQRIDGSEPYERELTLLGEAVLMGLEEAPGVDENGVRRSFAAPEALAAAASGGLPSPVTLAERFDAASRAALAAANRVTADESGGILDRLSTVMVVRRTDWTEGPEPDAVLARAGAHVARGDFAAAIAEIEGLGERLPEQSDEEANVAARIGDAARDADAMAAWLSDARSRASAETALAGLYAQLLNVETE